MDRSSRRNDLKDTRKHDLEEICIEINPMARNEYDKEKNPKMLQPHNYRCDVLQTNN